MDDTTQPDDQRTTHHDDDLARVDAVGLATMIRSGDLSAVEAVQATIDRIQA